MGGDDHMRVRGRVRNYDTSPAELFRSGADGPVARAHPLQRPNGLECTLYRLVVADA